MSKIILPEGWSNCTLADIAEVNPKKIEAEPDIIAGFVPMSHAPTNYYGKLEFEEKTWGEIGKSYTNFKNDDVIFAKVTPCFENGKAAIVKDMPNNIGAGSSEFYVLRARNQEIPASYLLGIIKTRKFMQEGAENMTGAVGLRRVPRAFVESFPLILPPLAEHKIIADKLDILLAQVESAKARLEQIPQILKRFRQAVLASAVSGKLIPKDQKSNVRFDVSVGSLCITSFDGPFGSKLKTADYTNAGVRVARLENIGHLTFNDEKETYISDTKFNSLKGNKLEKDDVLFSSFVDEDVRVCLFPHNDKIFINKADCFCLRINQEIASPKYVALTLASRTSYEQIKAQVQGVTRPRINLKTLRSLSFTFPSLQEQNEIVRRVEQLFAYADGIEKQVHNALECVNNLTQSILDKAFRGELTAQWRAENPDLISGENSAQALLVKIQQQRKNIKNIKRNKGNN